MTNYIGINESGINKRMGKILINSFAGMDSFSVFRVGLFFLIMGNISPYFYFILFFSVSVKVLPVTPLLSGVFVHGVFCPYFVRFEGFGVMRRFLWCTQENI